MGDGGKAMDQQEFQILPATENDIPIIFQFIKELAIYEKMLDQVVATEETLRQSLFGDRSFAEVVLGYEGREPVAFALFFHNFSTFRGVPGIYLEDLYVRQSKRGRGYGKALLAHLARVAIDRGCARLEWSGLGLERTCNRFL